jgi:hypothetical protein
MLEFINSLWLFISAIIAVVALGIIAGFSPTLYVTQIGIASSSKRARSFMIALMIGVLLGIILLSILFQFFQADTLHAFIDSALSALFVSVIFNILVGAAFIVAGFWYINKKPNRIDEGEKPTAKTGYWALISLGFFRTFFSISGATATFLASGIISGSRVNIVSWLILVLTFLAATVVPFLLILITMQHYPERIKNLLAWLKTQLLRYNYKLVIGVAAILIGSAIIIFNLLKAITY